MDCASERPEPTLADICRTAVGSSRLARRLFASHRRHTYVRPAREADAFAAALPNLHLDYCDGDVSFA